MVKIVIVIVIVIENSSYMLLLSWKNAVCTMLRVATIRMLWDPCSSLAFSFVKESVILLLAVDLKKIIYICRPFMAFYGINRWMSCH